MKINLVCLAFVDDTVLAGPNLDNINKEIHGLGVSNDDRVHLCQLRNDDQVKYL